jgi:hypothetical protein
VPVDYRFATTSTFEKTGIQARGTSNGYEAIDFEKSDCFVVIPFKKSNFSRKLKTDGVYRAWSYRVFGDIHPFKQ